MIKVLNKLRWCVHRALCYMGIHAPERNWRMPGPDQEVRNVENWVASGWSCGICHKYWRGKG